ncbi:MAG: AAA family ATPase [Clostridia bacterium]|nr:AAA family ATPase [Clostridia bacterium]
MKPIKLEIEGLNSFEGKETLDFSALGEGVFGIFGKTGSGKSTILDAITLALYGGTERSKQNIDFVNTKRKKAVVSFEFEINGSRGKKKYFITRTFEIKKAGVESDAELYETQDDDKILIAEGTAKVNAKIFDIVGLGEREFSKCIALPQGEFSAFLKAKPSERTEIMSNIFDLSDYGEKLSQKVKEKLNEFDKEVSSLESGLEMVAYATNEAVEERKKVTTDSLENYNQKSELLKQKSELYAEKQKTEEKQIKLVEIENKLSKINENQAEMELLADEIAKNLTANEIKSDYEKLKKTREDVASLTEKIASLNEVQLKAKSEAEEAAIDLENYQSEFTSKTAELQAKLLRLDDLRKLDEELKNLQKEKEDTAAEIIEKKAEVLNKNEANEFVQKNLDEIQEKIDKIDDFIDANKPDVDLSYALEQTKGIESEIILIDEIYAKVEALIDQTEADLKSVQEEYNSAIASEKQFQAQREKIQGSIEVAFENDDSTNFKKLRSCEKQLVGMHEVQVNVKDLDEQIARIDLDTDNRLATISMLDGQIDEANAKLNEMEDGVIQAEVLLNQARDSREEVLGENVVSLISEHLNIGDECPVCSSRVNQKIYGNHFDLMALDGEVENAKTNVKGRRFERDRAFVEVISLKARYEFEKAQVEINRSEIKKLQEARGKLFQKFVDNNDDSEANFEKLQTLVENAANSLEELINLQDSIREAEERTTILKVQAGTKVTIYKNYLESLIDVIYELQKKKAEREFAIYNVNAKYENLKEYKQQIADGKNIEIIIDGKKEERAKLREKQNEINKEFVETQKEVVAATGKLEFLSEKLNSLEKQIFGVKTKIVTSGVPEGVSIDEEKEQTIKAIEELKFNFDAKQSKLYSSRELVSRTESDYTISLTLINEKRDEIEKLEADVARRMIDANFKSDEELEKMFITSSELQIKKNKLDEFNSEKRILEIQKAEIEKEITEKVDKTEIENLEKEIQSLNEEVKTLSQEVGKNNADFDRILADNAKFNEISTKLAVAKHGYDNAKELSTVLKGKALAEFVAEEYLDEITTSANKKLDLLMDGKYTLLFKDKEFIVQENLNDGLERSAGTLSGGETFLVSLSLALSISEAISLLSARSMDFFFLDEGFGTLDADLCEAVVGALYKLESQNLKIGLISHVKELEESIKNKVLVSKDTKGSHIKIAHSL